MHYYYYYYYYYRFTAITQEANLRQPAFAVKNWKISSQQSFTARIALLTAISARF